MRASRSGPGAGPHPASLTTGEPRAASVQESGAAHTAFFGPGQAAATILRRAASLLGLLFFFLALLFLYRWLDQVPPAALRGSLETIAPSGLALAFGLTLVNYAAITSYDFISLASINRRLPLRTVARTSLIANAFSNNVGNALITGSAIRYWLYKPAGLTDREIVRIAFLCSVGLWPGFLAAASVDLIAFPAARLALPDPVGRIAGAVAWGFLLLLVASLVLLAMPKLRLHAAGSASFPSLAVVVKLLLAGAADLCLMASVFYALVNQIADLPFSSCLVIVLVGLIAGNLSFVPGGLGVFEAALVLQLAPLTSAAALPSVLLAFRAIYYVLPLLFAAALVAARESASLAARWHAARASLRACLLAAAPRAIALLVFVAGTLLMFSGAVPAASGRLDTLNRVLALPFIEISHFAASLAGGALLLLARALQRRLDAGWQLAILLLGAGTVLSLFKGWDFEEASVLGLACLTLLPLRRQFYRRSSLLGEPFTPAWVAAIAAVLMASMFLLLFSHAQTPFAHLSWWDFSLHSEAPRSQRATIAATALIGLFGFYRLLRPACPPLQSPGPAELAHAGAIAQGSAATYANLVLRGDKALLFSPAGDAFLMYGRRGRSWIAMGEPVGPEASARELLWQFRNVCDRCDAWCVLFEVSDKWRAEFAELGLLLTPLGEEARVSLAAFTLATPARKKLREVRSRLLRRGYRFRLLSGDELAAALPALEAVSQAWLSAKHTAEKGFSNASFDRRYLSLFPVAVIESDAGIVAFANLWLGAGKIELSIDLMRHLPTAANGTMDLLFSEMMLWGRSQGYQWFNLGMAPLSNLRAQSQTALWPHIGTLIFRHGEHFYNFEGLRRYKEKFEPVWRPLYLASPGGLVLPAILVDVTALVAGSLSRIVTRRGGSAR